MDRRWQVLYEVGVLCGAPDPAEFANWVLDADDVCECSHLRKDHADVGCMGEVTVYAPPLPPYDRLCKCGQFEFWYRDE